MNKYNREILCSNCGLKGHIYKKCTKPKISLGVIAFKYNIKTDNIKYLMIQRKDSHGFVEFIRGKYNINDINFLQRIIDEMTIKEKKLLETKPFIDLWKVLWRRQPNQNNKRQYNEYLISQDKFNTLKKGYKNTLLNKIINLSDLIKKSKTKWKTPEWGFPKGRRNMKESDYNCAIREFREETSLRDKDFIIYNNIDPFSETFLGSNNIKYRSIYYIGKIITNKPIKIDSNNYYQISEIGDIKLLDYKDCLSIIRPYSIKKIELLKYIHKLIKLYKIYNKSSTYRISF